MKKIFLIVVVNSSVLFAQANVEWVARYNWPANNSDYANSIAVDDSGNVYVTGYSGYVFQTHYYFDYATIKYNASGVELWAARYNGPGNLTDDAAAIALDDSGNVYVTGSSYGIGTYYDFATIKYNSYGVEQWVQRYNSSGFDYARSIAVDDSGNVYVVGSVGNNYTTIKYSSSGIQQWVAAYDGPANAYDEAYSIAVDASGNVYITGESMGIGTNNYDYATIKYNSLGVQQWVQRYIGPGNDQDYAYSISVDIPGNVYVTGASMGNGTNLDYATIKYNSLGVQQWVQRYNGPGNAQDRSNSISVDVSGNVYITGSSQEIGNIDGYATIKYSSLGVQQWVQRYDQGIAENLVTDIQGNVYVTGWSADSSTGADYTTIKYNSLGIEQWIQIYNGPANGNDFAHSLCIDISGNVYVTGYSAGNGTGADYATIKYSQIIGIDPINSEIPKEFGLLQNYPNPFNPQTKIKFGVPKGSNVSLIIFDITGKHIAEPVNFRLNPGTYEITWDASKYPSGVYFYKLETNEFSETKKMVLVK